MKRFFILCSCFAIALCAWAAWPNSPDSKGCKDGINDGVHSYCELPVNTANNSDWVLISDDCDKCVVNDRDRKCGKCGGFLSEKCTDIKGDYLYYTLTCKKCNHKCKYKVKYK